MLELIAKLEIVGDDDAATLRRAALALHVADVENSREHNDLEDRALLKRLTPLLQPITTLAQRS